MDEKEFHKAQIKVIAMVRDAIHLLGTVTKEGFDTSHISFISQDVVIHWYRWPPEHFLNYLEGPNTGQQWLRIRLPDRVVTVGMNISTTYPVENGTGYPNRATIASPETVEEAVDQALRLVAEDLGYRSLAGVAERIAGKERGGFAALNRLQGVRAEFNL